MAILDSVKRVLIGDPGGVPVVPKPPRLNIQAVITCANYADFLAYTLPHNKHAFDRVVVVTSKEDTATRRVCEFWDVECLPTDAFTARGKFCKADGINEGLKLLGPAVEWVAHMDADILLPPKAKWLIEVSRPDPAFLYGIDRMNVRSFEEWAEFLISPSPQHQWRTYLHQGAFPTGSRIVREDHGWLPLGFFQLWNAPASGVAVYPNTSTDAARDDVLFSMIWPRERRAFLPEIVAYHLESVKAEKGANWHGRTTPKFGPTLAQKETEE